MGGGQEKGALQFSDCCGIIGYVASWRSRRQRTRDLEIVPNGKLNNRPCNVSSSNIQSKEFQKRHGC